MFEKAHFPVLVVSFNAASCVSGHIWPAEFAARHFLLTACDSEEEEDRDVLRTRTGEPMSL